MLCGCLARMLCFFLSLLLLLLQSRSACSACPSYRPSCRGRATCTAWYRPRCVHCSTCCRRAKTCPGLSTAACRSNGELSTCSNCCCWSCYSRLDAVALVAVAAASVLPAGQASTHPLALQQNPWPVRPPPISPSRRNVPAGVLYDLVAAPSGELPWRLTIHFRGFPSK